MPGLTSLHIAGIMRKLGLTNEMMVMSEQDPDASPDSSHQRMLENGAEVAVPVDR
jgi:hypothetical protein